MKTKISTKTHYVRTDAWRGYVEPIDAVCGANDTGTWSDSPCRSEVADKELAMARAILKKAKIPSKHMVCESSNVFCAHRYLVVPSEDTERGRELIQPIIGETYLLYIAGKK
jgi:hypothetical protein